MPVFLYLNVHREYYLSIANLLRLHSSKSFNCLRSALDMAFTAYYLLKNPEDTKIFMYKTNKKKQARS